MDWGINDSLKARSYAGKDSYIDQVEKASMNGSIQNQHFGEENKNDWDTLTRKQHEMYRKYEEDERRQVDNQK